MKALIKNLTGNPISLPAPYAGVLAGGGGTVIDIGASTPDAFAAQYIDLFGGPNVVSISEMPGESPIGQITPASTATGIASALAASTAAVSVNGQKITNLGAPTANTDAATKLYVDTHGGGGSGTVTQVNTGTGLTGGPITASGTIALATPVATSNGGTGVSASGSSHGVFGVSGGVGGLTPLVYANYTIGAEVANAIAVNFQLRNGTANYTAQMGFSCQILGSSNLGNVAVSAGAAGQVFAEPDFATSGRFKVVTNASGVANLIVTDTNTPDNVQLLWGTGPGTNQLFLGDADGLNFA